MKIASFADINIGVNTLARGSGIELIDTMHMTQLQHHGIMRWHVVKGRPIQRNIFKRKVNPW